MDHLVEQSKKYDEYYPTKEYEEQFINYVNQYDNDSFWGELPIRLANRDIEESGETFETHEEAMQHRFQVESTYEDEFEEHGIKRLRIQKSDQD
ncbi:hypothetical protein ACTWQB_12040 [Piscibacillus sp. B03]|uniref:hypothetical protein n=1 Tax=Piscibacillus sp. B03 TaxID=3457430 RepID=UPI003FCEA4B8